MRSFLHCQPTDRTKKNTDFYSIKKQNSKINMQFQNEIGY